MAQSNDLLGNIFDLYDADKSGFIEAAEGHSIAHHMGKSDKAAYWKEMLDKMDADGDGKISKQEYIDHMTAAGTPLDDLANLKNELLSKGFGAGEVLWAAAAPPTTILMSKLLEAVEAAHVAGKTPLLIDATDPDKKQDFSPLETFYNYSGDQLFEAKKMVVEVNMKKEKTLEEAREEVRQKLVRAIKHGTMFVILMSSSAPPFKSKFADDATIPLALFDGALVNAAATALEGSWAEKVIRPEDECFLVSEKFKVVVVTKFAKEDYAEFLKKDTPIEKLQHLVVVAES